MGNGLWVFGVQSYADVLRTVKHYTLDGVADQIVAPTLIMEGEHDTMLKGQPERVEKALTGRQDHPGHPDRGGGGRGTHSRRRSRHGPTR